MPSLRKEGRILLGIDRGGINMSKIFEGIKVLDFTSNLAGPGSTALFADFGAEVIKIEKPIVGDDIRGISPRIEGQAIFGMWSNRGKKSVVIALDDAEGQAMLKEIIKDADVMVESFKPGTMDKFGLDYKNVIKINPEIVYCSISACGQTGVYRKEPGFDIIAQGMSGIMDLTGPADGAPVKSGTTIGDYVGALSAYGAMVTALFHKMKTGEGQYIDISLLDGLVAINSTIEAAANLNTHPTRTGNHYINMAPYGVYNGKNGQSIILAAYNGTMWPRLCNVIGRPDMIDSEAFGTNVARLKNINNLVEIIETWLCQFDDISEAVKILKDAKIACCKIKTTDEVVNDPALYERGTIIEVETAPSFKEHKTIKTRGPWMKLSKTPAQPHRSCDLGEHTYEILERYGFEKDKIEELEQKWSAK